MEIAANAPLAIKVTKRVVNLQLQSERRDESILDFRSQILDLLNRNTDG